ncbi:hypothetical protein Ancab_010162 [Ancistrocladus abbreviatus]
MFPLQRSCELSFRISNPAEEDHPHHHHEQPLQINQQEQVGIIISGHRPSASADNSNISTGRKGRQRAKSQGDHTKLNHDDDGDQDGNNRKKRILHREIERQRRLDMSKLFSSLRALLPPEHIKGKRSVCDHVVEAANYVKNLQKSIKQLETKRVALKRTSESSEFSQCQVDVHSCSGGGMEVKISVGVREAIRLSRFLSVLLEEGLDVVSCVSTKANKRWLHIIHAQVGNSSCMDPSWLQQRLTSKVCPRVP